MGYISELLEKGKKLIKHNTNIVPSYMDQGYEILIKEYAKKHTDIAFAHQNSELFKDCSAFAESYSMGELDEAINILVDLLDARVECSRKIT